MRACQGYDPASAVGSLIPSSIVLFHEAQEIAGYGGQRGIHYHCGRGGNAERCLRIGRICLTLFSKAPQSADDDVSPAFSPDCPLFGRSVRRIAPPFVSSLYNFRKQRTQLSSFDLTGRVSQKQR